MVARRQARLERHRRGDPGAPRGRCRRRARPPGARRAPRAFQNRDGGFSLTKGRESDAQSTAWAIQALLSAGEKPGKAPFRFLARLRRADGSYRYSVRYGTTPVWVTAQVLPALAGRPFPLR